MCNLEMLKFECSKLSKFLLFWMQAFSLFFTAQPSTAQTIFVEQLENIYHANMDEMKDFPALVSKIENDHPDAVAFKIIPPPEWKAKYGGYNETSDLIDNKRIYPKLMLSTNLGNEIVQIFNNPPHHFEEIAQHKVKVYLNILNIYLILKSGRWINCNKSTQH